MLTDRQTTIRQKLAQSRQETLSSLQGLSETQWNTVVYSEEAEWRAADLLRHMTHAEQSMTRLIEAIRDGGEGVSPDFDLTRWNARAISKMQDKTPAGLFAEMAQNRERLWEVMDTLTNEDLDKKGRHGSLRILSIEEVLHLIADHEARHVNHIREAVY